MSHQAGRGALTSMRQPQYMAMLLVPVAGAIGFVPLLTYFPAALQAVRGESPGTAGAMMLAMTLPVLIAPTAVHRLGGTRWAPSPASLCTLALACLIVAPLALVTFGSHTPAALVLLAFAVDGLGFGLPLGVVDGHALSYIPPRQQGFATGVLNFFRIGSEALFVAAYGALLAWLIQRRPEAEGVADRIAAGQPGHPDVYVAALHPLLIGIAIVDTVLLLVLLRLTRRARTPDAVRVDEQVA